MKSKLFPMFLVLLMSLGTAQLAEAKLSEKPPKWVMLGTRKVNYTLDKDVMVLGAKEGVYTSLKLKVVEGGLNMHRMVVTYGNGQRDEIDLKHNFVKGSETRVIDLKGHARVIKSITFWYDTKNFSGRKAKILVFGRKPAR
jgi:hypothetical protein